MEGRRAALLLFWRGPSWMCSPPLVSEHTTMVISSLFSGNFCGFFGGTRAARGR